MNDRETDSWIVFCFVFFWCVLKVPSKKNGSSQRTGIKTPEQRPTNLMTFGSSFTSSSLEASSPIGASLMMRKMRTGMSSGGHSGGGNYLGSETRSSGSGMLGMPSFSPKVGSPLNESLMMGDSQPSSPMGAALLRRKQSGRTTTMARGGPIELGGGASDLSMGSSPLRRVIQHPVVPGVVSSVLTEEEEAPSSPMSGALLRKKRIRQQERGSPLRLSSEGGGRTKSGGKSPTFRNLSKGFFDGE